MNDIDLTERTGQIVEIARVDFARGPAPTMTTSYGSERKLVATTERWKHKDGRLQEHTEWFAVKAFNRLAEVAGEQLHKSTRVYLEGRKHTESWDDKQTGGKHYRDLVGVDRIEFLEPKGGNGNSKTGESASDETTVTMYALADWLAECRVKSVAMESTGVYWIPLFPDPRST